MTYDELNTQYREYCRVSDREFEKAKRNPSIPRKYAFVTAVVATLAIMATSCDVNTTVSTPTKPAARSGVQQAQIEAGTIQTDSTGKTIEQRNILRRYAADNKPGSIKHLYVISAFSGDVILYSPVDGKVTSSSKRLTPTQVAAGMGVDSDAFDCRKYYGPRVSIGGEEHRTSEVLQDDGTYGSSIEYLYWFDTKGVYHQHYVTGGQIVHVSSTPVRVGKVIIDISTAVDAEVTE